MLMLEVPITALHEGASRHMFDFSYDGKECYCYIASMLPTRPMLSIGQTVRLTGQWSSALLKVFEAQAIEVISNS